MKLYFKGLQKRFKHLSRYVVPCFVSGLFLGFSGMAHGGTAVVFDQYRNLVAYSYGNKSENRLVAEAIKRLEKKGGIVTKYEYTPRRGYGTIVRKGNRFGYSAGHPSRALADQVALLYAGQGARIIARWRDK